MKAFVILSVLVAGAIGARLDNTYIPPANARAAGGHNLDTPRLALASNVQNTFASPAGARGGQTQFQAQSFRQPGLNQGTFTSISSGNGYQAVSVGAHSGTGQGHYPAPAPQQNYQPQPSYQPQPQPQQQYNYQQQNTGYNQASTTPIPILEFENEPHSGDGRYRFKYLTGNGIMAQEEGYLNNPNAQYPDYPEQVAVGSYSYTAPDGQLISLTYKADANGFQPEGAHLPTPVPLPAEYYEQVELHKKVAAEIEAEGQRLLALQAQLAQNQPQHNQYQPQARPQAHNQYQHQAQHSPQSSPNYHAQASNQVYQQAPQTGYNYNAQPQQQYLPPQKYGKK